MRLYIFSFPNSVWECLPRCSASYNHDNLSPAKDLEEVLNLNHETLVRNRKQTYKGVIQSMTQTHKKGKQVTWQYSFIKKKIQEHESKNKEGKYMEYCKIVVYLLKKRIGER